MLIAHFSDIHLLTLRGVHPFHFLGKRATGGVNLLLNRGGEFPVAVVRALVQDLNEQAPEQVLVSGDLTNLAFPGEFELARGILTELKLPASDITIVPGNHDYYTRQSFRADHFGRIMRSFLQGDIQPGPDDFPFLRLRGDLAIVALRTARPSAPLLAVGSLGDRQIEQAEHLLSSAECQKRFRLVVLHHAPCPSHVKWHNRLTDANAFLAMLRRVGAELVVHGHLHRALQQSVPGPEGQGPIPVIGVGSGTWLSPRDAGRRAQYNLYEIEGRRLIQVKTRKYELLGKTFVPC